MRLHSTLKPWTKFWLLRELTSLTKRLLRRFRVGSTGFVPSHWNTPYCEHRFQWWWGRYRVIVVSEWDASVESLSRHYYFIDLQLKISTAIIPSSKDASIGMFSRVYITGRNATLFYECFMATIGGSNAEWGKRNLHTGRNATFLVGWLGLQMFAAMHSLVLLIYLLRFGKAAFLGFVWQDSTCLCFIAAIIILLVAML